MENNLWPFSLCSFLDVPERNYHVLPTSLFSLFILNISSACSHSTWPEALYKHCCPLLICSSLSMPFWKCWLTIFQVGSHQCEVARNNDISCLWCDAFSNVAQNSISLWTNVSHCWFMFNLLALTTPKSFSDILFPSHKSCMYSRFFFLPNYNILFKK